VKRRFNRLVPRRACNWLLHGGEKVVLGDAGYQGMRERPENADKQIDWHVAMRPSVRKTLKKYSLGRAKEKLEKTTASVRAKVEHCFHVVKCLFKHRNTRYWVIPPQKSAFGSGIFYLTESST